MRAVAFYEYQTSQEIAFRATIQKSIQEKYKVLKDQFDIATRDLNHIIKGIGLGLISAYMVKSNYYSLAAEKDKITGMQSLSLSDQH